MLSRLPMRWRVSTGVVAARPVLAGRRPARRGRAVPLATAAALAALLLACAWPASAQTRSARLHIERVVTAVATLQDVTVRLTWHADALHGQLHLHAATLRAAELGYRFDDLDWTCRLHRDQDDGWRCAGPVRAAGGTPLRLSVAWQGGEVDASLADDGARIAVHHDAATPDLTRIDLTRVPLLWTQAMLSQAWPAGQLVGGTLDSRLTVSAAADQPLRISGPVHLTNAALDTPDGRIAVQGLGASLAVDARLGSRDVVTVQGQLQGGEILFGNTYVALQERAVQLQVEATHGDDDGWHLPRIVWRDSGILAVRGSAAFSAEAELRALDLQLHSPALAPLRDGYLSAWLGLAGLGEMTMTGSADAQVHVAQGELRAASLSLHRVDIDHPDDRFGFDNLRGQVRYSASTPVTSALRWSGGELYGLAFGAARMAFASSAGVLRLREPLTMPLLGGRARFDHLRIRPPADEHGLEVRFGLALEQLDVGRLTQALGWPAFTGQLSGRIAQARYADDRLDFDGGLSMQVFGGDVMVSSLSMERPFGVAPTLSADIRFDDLGLRALTGAFDFGTVTGKLDGRILDLRLVDWQAVAFDAWMHTDRQRGVPQRVSQRAVQDLTSVGEASFASGLQALFIGLFDNFGYDAIGLGCRLRQQVCTMEGLGSAGTGFTIVEGSGLPHLTVIGFNRRVDWPMLVERLKVVGSGEVEPVVR